MTRTLSEVVVDQVLKNAIVKRRWYDESEYRYWTLVEYKLDD